MIFNVHTVEKILMGSKGSGNYLEEKFYPQKAKTGIFETKGTTCMIEYCCQSGVLCFSAQLCLG